MSTNGRSSSLPDGYTLRPAELADAAAVTGVVNACSIERIGKPDWEVQELISDWQSPHVNLDRDTRVVVGPDGLIVGYTDVWDPPPHVRIHSMGEVHPDYRGRGIGSAMVGWLEQRALESVSEAPEGARVALMQGTLSTDRRSQQILGDNGFTVARHYYRMVIKLEQEPPKPAVPDGIIFRPYNPKTELPAIIRAVQDAFKDHWGYVETPFDNMLQTWSHWIENDPDHDPSLWFLAMDGDEIAGLSLCKERITEDHEMAWVNTLGVRRPWRRRGLALALLHHSFGEFYRRGKVRAGLGVDATSLTGATRLYERAGMHVARQYTSFEKELRPGEELATQSVPN